MTGRSSNKDRIQRMAAEADAAQAERKAKQEETASKAPTKKATAKKATTKSGSSRKSAADKKSTGRTKVVWCVCDVTGKAVETYPYKDESAAKASAKTRTRESGRNHFLRRDVVPME